MEPCCDSDEEVFYGKLTLKEVRKALTLRRKTEVFKPVENEEEEPEAMEQQQDNWREASCVPTLQGDAAEQETPAPPPSPENITYNGSPYPTPYRYRRQLSSSLAGIAEDLAYPPQSTPKNPGQCPALSRFSEFGDWRDSHVISYSSDVSNVSASPGMDSLVEDAPMQTRTRNMLIAKMMEHQEKTERLRSTRKPQADVDENVSVDLEDKSCRYSRLTSERCTPSPTPFLGELERRYGRERVATLNEDHAKPPSPEFDTEVPHAVVAGNYSLISEASVQADEDGGYLSVLSEAALYHASLKQPQNNTCDSVVILNNSSDIYHETFEREMDASSDLNEKDKKDLEHVTCSSEEGFHDTLEEMELMLKLGMDYITGGQDAKQEHVVKPQAATKIPQAVVAPIIQVKPKPSPFKVPVKPLVLKKTPLKPATTPPCKKMSQYDRIVSPVSAYIHTPSPSLVKNVKPRTPSHMMLKKSRDPAPAMPEMLHRGRENINTTNLQPVLPIVTYKSAPSVKLEQEPRERMPRVNEKLKKLVDTPRPRVIRHEGRVRVTPSPKSRGMLHYNDSNSDAEISVVVGKRVSCTNTLGM